jgi:methylmalonyl-CoA/ethylmalonyl-CoA epimerase
MNPDASTPEIHLNDIGQIAITVTDLARSKDFYQNVLGMQFLFDAGPMSFFQCGKIRFAIGTSPELPGKGGTILYFRVAQMADHDLWLAFLNDPDKQTIGLMCEMPRSAASAAG